MTSSAAFFPPIKIVQQVDRRPLLDLKMILLRTGLGDEKRPQVGLDVVAVVVVAVVVVVVDAIAVAG